MKDEPPLARDAHAFRGRGNPPACPSAYLAARPAKIEETVADTLGSLELISTRDLEDDLQLYAHA